MLATASNLEMGEGMNRRGIKAIGVSVGFAVLYLGLAGCINLSGDLTINADASFSGKERYEISRQIAVLAGITSLDSLKAQASSPSSTKSSSECPNVGYSETASSFVVECTFSSTPLTTGDLTAIKQGDGILFKYEQSSDSMSSTSGADSGIPGLGDGNLGSTNLTINFPGDIQVVGGANANKATKVDADTITIQATATEKLDIQVTSAIRKVSVASKVKSIGLILGIVLAGLLVVAAFIVGVIALVRKRRNPSTPSETSIDSTDTARESGQDASDLAGDSAPGVDAQGSSMVTPEPAATAGPPSGWYPDPEGDGQRYWDGTGWATK